MKNASFAAMQLMMASTAFGLRTLPMEGFDERRLRAVLAIPEEYSIPVVVSVGHSADVNDVLPKLAAGVVADNSASTRTEDSNDSAVDAETAPRASPNLKVRFPLHDMCYVDQFGNPAKFNW